MRLQIRVLYRPLLNAEIAQLVEHLFCNQAVGDSSSSFSTILGPVNTGYQRGVNHPPSIVNGSSSNG